MSKTDQALSSALGIEPSTEIVEVKTIEHEIIVQTNSESDQDDDYRLSRKTFRDLINKGNSAIEDLTDLAKESESPRAYEVLATLMKTVSDATKDLYDLQKKTKELRKLDGNGKPAESITVEKAVFFGTPSELLAKMKESKTSE
jgi:hypothetical protein